MTRSTGAERRRRHLRQTVPQTGPGMSPPIPPVCTIPRPHLWRACLLKRLQIPQAPDLDPAGRLEVRDVGKPLPSRHVVATPSLRWAALKLGDLNLQLRVELVAKTARPAACLVVCTHADLHARRYYRLRSNDLGMSPEPRRSHGASGQHVAQAAPRLVRSFPLASIKRRVRYGALREERGDQERSSSGGNPATSRHAPLGCRAYSCPASHAIRSPRIA